MGKRFLVVEDDEPQARAFARSLGRRGGDVSVATNRRDAEALITDDAHWDAVFIDLRLPDGNGLEVLSRLRSGHEHTRAVLVAGDISHDQINAAFDLDAAILMKPIAWDRIDRFLMGGRTLTERIEARARIWAERYGLSPAEVKLLVSMAAGARRSELAEASGRSPLTIKSHVRNLLAKLGEGSLQEAAHQLLLEAADDSRD